MALHPTYPIATNRLSLRPLLDDDAEALLAYTAREDVCRYVPWGPLSLEDVRARLDGGFYSRSELTEPGQAIVLGVAEPEHDVVVGHLMLRWYTAEHRDGEVGWVLDPGVQGRGYATEATHALLHLAFDDLGLHRVVARIDARNLPSTRVAERLGMRHEATFRECEWIKEAWCDEVVFALLDAEWRDAHANGCPVFAASRPR